jgi:hypothetical protein
MTWMETWTGRVIHPLDPKPEQIYIVDIAHGLANTCRYNGQCQFYSVAEHSVHLARYFRQRSTAMCALMHDAAEAYTPDIVAPIKPSIPEFRDIENRLMRVIRSALAFPTPTPADARLVKLADTRILLNERDAVLPSHRAGVDWGIAAGPLPGVKIECWTPDEAEQQFMREYWRMVRWILED